MNAPLLLEPLFYVGLIVLALVATGIVALYDLIVSRSPREAGGPEPQPSPPSAPVVARRVGFPHFGRTYADRYSDACRRFGQAAVDEDRNLIR